MNRLQIELERLYGLDGGAAGRAPGADAPGTRALVLELAQPAGWPQLSAVWKGIQADLELPAAAIAISGVDRLQLWFSLASPLPPGAGAAFLEGLRARYLPEVALGRVRLAAQAAELPAAPPVEIAPDRWSAFVAPDLAALFAETPWLDLPPSDDGQAALLRPLEPIATAAFDAALRQLGATDGGARTASSPANPLAAPAPPTPPTLPGSPAPTHGDPVRFLASVMADETAPLALRVDAAKALLPYVRPPHPAA